jgi:hypothetical protein
MTHSELVAEILKLSRGPVRLFRSNAGVAWQGNIVQLTDYRIVMHAPRAIRVGVEGMADITGWVAGQYAAIEVKTGLGRPTTQQKAFINAVLNSGGRAGIAHDLQEAAAILGI